jgi:hypothetical protein|uniref:Uncharacterized protein n=1 Tax=Rhodococcus jostii (strain RHA1) TaxID=101510 RepID=Q0S137_RHOJR|nr:hypothetical protein RHA1_ro06983 [Rhodococcus jostii RHA1]
MSARPDFLASVDTFGDDCQWCRAVTELRIWARCLVSRPRTRVRFRPRREIRDEIVREVWLRDDIPTLSDRHSTERASGAAGVKRGG